MRRFEAALARIAHREVELVWRSCELDVSVSPSSAEQGTSAERLATRYRCSVTEAQAMIDTKTVPASDHSALRARALQVGLPKVEVDAVLTSDRHSDAVRADEAQAMVYGISGVPYFVIDGRYGISGAQPADAVVQTLERAWSERPPLPLVIPEGTAPSCGGDSCTGSAADEVSDEPAEGVASRPHARPEDPDRPR